MTGFTRNIAPVKGRRERSKRSVSFMSLAYNESFARDKLHRHSEQRCSVPIHYTVDDVAQRTNDVRARM
jgi:hypothetical protein